MTVPPGDELWAIATTDGAGNLTFSVPTGHAWCLAEESVPAGFLRDAGLHCTSVLTTSSPAAATIVALPEVAVIQLAATGVPLVELAALGGGLLASGAVVLAVRRRRRA